MKELLTDMSALISLKRINRDVLAKELGTSRPNLLSALKGRRPLPSVYWPGLREFLGLDEMYHFQRGRIHGITVKDTKKQYIDLFNVLLRFATFPIKTTWYLCGIGERGKEGIAFGFESIDGTLFFIRNDDAMLKDMSHSYALRQDFSQWKAISDAIDDAASQPEKEIPYSFFVQLFLNGGDLSENTCRAMLRINEKVWTWARLKDKAEQMGLSVDDAAKRLGFI